jgi:hypothetical protein
MTLLFVLLGVRRSNRTTLRGDEVLTVLWTRETPGVWTLVRHGARGEVSPAPAFHVLARIVDSLRVRLNYLGLTYSGYFRLTSVLFTAGFGVAAALLLAFRLPSPGSSPPLFSWVLILCGLAAYWFQPKVFSFACTARVYATWNGLWLLTLVWLLCRPSSRAGPAILLSLLASVATAACFQILAVGVAIAVARRLEGRSWREIVKTGVPMFALPTVIGIYYAAQARGSGPETESDAIHGLLKFWLVTNLPAWIAAGVAGLLVWFLPQRRPLLPAVAAFSILLLMVPLIFLLAQAKGYTNPSRYYVWTTTGIPLALFVGALAGPDLRRWTPAPAIAVVLGIGLAAGFAIATFLRPPVRNDSRRLTCLDPDCPLGSLLDRAVPGSLVHPPTLGPIETQNLELLAEWLRFRYRSLPRTIGAAPIREAKGELVSDPLLAPADVPPDWRAIPVSY